LRVYSPNNHFDELSSHAPIPTIILAVDHWAGKAQSETKTAGVEPTGELRVEEFVSVMDW
jgi:hypothetical protein